MPCRVTPRTERDRRGRGQEALRRAGCARTRQALAGVVGANRVVDPGPGTGSEDVGILADSPHAPCAYWLLGGADPRAFGDAQDFETLARVVRGLPSNHSPRTPPSSSPR
ncbi:hypothetical protein [Streptomyces hirsutus]|uniref:hypothetical protein n=1 Tax=Streptomyces hirsutus TaxID=35620 RepID=UPI000A64AE6B|nr:hypothetical protein [Streptomyces hirsutus]